MPPELKLQRFFKAALLNWHTPLPAASACDWAFSQEPYLVNGFQDCLWHNTPGCDWQEHEDIKVHILSLLNRELLFSQAAQKNIKLSAQTQASMLSTQVLW